MTIYRARVPKASILKKTRRFSRQQIEHLRMLVQKLPRSAPVFRSIKSIRTYKPRKVSFSSKLVTDIAPAIHPGSPSATWYDRKALKGFLIDTHRAAEQALAILECDHQNRCVPRDLTFLGTQVHISPHRKLLNRLHVLAVLQEQEWNGCTDDSLRLVASQLSIPKVDRAFVAAILLRIELASAEL